MPTRLSTPHTICTHRCPGAGSNGTTTHTPLLEVETYTWGVLPPAFRGDPLDLAIARELAWAKEHL